MKGFTLAEFIIVITIVTVVTFVSFFNLFNYRSHRDVSLTIDEIVAVVRNTQTRSVTQENGQQWGIRFKNDSDDQYEVFKGLSYSSTTVDRIYNLRRGLKFSEPAEGFLFDIVFNPITGRPNFSKIISLIGGFSNQKIVGDIIINTSGLITTRLEEGVSGYWHFDEKEGAFVYDASGNNNTGTLVNSPVWQPEANCKAGGCLSFNGTNKYINIPNSSSLQVFNDMTLELWVYATNCAAGRQGILYKSYNNEFELILEPDCKVSFYQGNGVWEEIQEPSGFNVSQNTWTHLAVVRTIGNKTLYFYKNGALVGSDEYVNSPTASMQPVIIGKRDGTTYYFNGSIDEVRIYNRALTSVEIQTIYNSLK